MNRCSAGWLSRRTVRTSWPSYLGAFIALGSGVVLIATTVGLVASVESTLTSLGAAATQGQRQQLEDLTSLFGIMSAVSMFMAIFVVASTFGFVVATRRSELGLLRLVGATGRQVRRLVLGESLVVAVAASVAGCLVATTLIHPVLAMVRRLGLTDLHLVAPPTWLAWSIAAPTGLAVAVVGAWRSSRRAAKVPPSAALREATVERPWPSLPQWIVGSLCVATVIGAAILAPRAEPLFALVAAVLLPEVVVIGLMCFGPLVVPRVARLLARPFVARDVAARLARDELRSAIRSTTSVAAPVVAISAIAGSMLLALSFTADWTSALDRAQLRAPLVVVPGPGHETRSVEAVRADPAVRLVDARQTLTLSMGRDGYEREEVDAVDVATATAARGLRATRGSLDDLTGGSIAVTETWRVDSGTGLGGHVLAKIDGHERRLKIVAVVSDAPDLYSDLIVPSDLVRSQLRDASPSELFVLLRPGADPSAARSSLERALPPGGEVRTADQWIDAVTADARAANDLGLTMLLGPAGFYAAIAMVNATLIGASQRRRQLRVLGLLGATTDQIRRVAVWQAMLVTASGLVLGGLTTGLLGWMVRRAVTADLAGTGVQVPMTIPWLPLAAIVALSVLLAVAASVAGSRRKVVASLLPQD